MFLVQCPACGQRDLRSPRAFSSFHSTDHGIEISVGCSRCGTEVHVLTGTVAPVAPGAATSEAGVAA